MSKTMIVGPGSSLFKPLTRSASLGLWGHRQYLLDMQDRQNWTNWVYAWVNPHPAKEIDHIECISKFGTVVLSGVSAAGKLQQNPLRWNRREKMCINVPKENHFPQILMSLGLRIYRWILDRLLVASRNGNTLGRGIKAILISQLTHLKMTLTSAHRKLHNQMQLAGVDHDHTATHYHQEHE